MSTTHKDMVYTIEIQDLISKWLEDCKDLSLEHKTTSTYLKRKYHVFGLLQLLIPISFTLANQIIVDPYTASTTSSVGFALSGITTVLLNFLSFKVQSVKHSSASNSFDILVNDIESIMSSQDQIESAVLIARIKCEIKNLKTYSPSLDDSCVSDICFR